MCCDKLQKEMLLEYDPAGVLSALFAYPVLKSLRA